MINQTLSDEPYFTIQCTRMILFLCQRVLVLHFEVALISKLLKYCKRITTYLKHRSLLGIYASVQGQELARRILETRSVPWLRLYRKHLSKSLHAPFLLFILGTICGTCQSSTSKHCMYCHTAPKENIPCLLHQMSRQHLSNPYMNVVIVFICSHGYKSVSMVQHLALHPISIKSFPTFPRDPKFEGHPTFQYRHICHHTYHRVRICKGCAQHKSPSSQWKLQIAHGKHAQRSYRACIRHRSLTGFLAISSYSCILAFHQVAVLNLVEFSKRLATDWEICIVSLFSFLGEWMTIHSSSHWVLAWHGTN